MPEYATSTMLQPFYASGEFDVSNVDGCHDNNTTCVDCDSIDLSNKSGRSSQILYG
eukprot:m.167104 g.167104  ORF g.167104 m.167104 type:complete len:56 (-) comp31452_c5_seq1:66-233(-)